MVASELDVIMGAGHPFFDDNNAQLDVPNYNYVSEETYNALANGETEFTFFDETADFESLAAGNVTEGERYFGLPQVGSTLQQGRDGDAAEPYADEMNGVVDLSTMATGALNALNTNDEGFHLMIEGGAIDWAGHDNDSARDIEETQDFNDAVEAVVNWVETNSSWDETLVIVTADHETGYLSGQDENPEWRAITGQAGQVPNHEWYSEDPTNQVVPFFFRGAGSEDILAATTGTDPVRGDYVDNTTVANLTFENWWARD
ncbi:alkaline phosphatase [Corynebacterium yudongzhengii]|uniref:alkaline phosphatase n=1 Tax=Corynebacterium yudongzhengii TaxID=2080740 RepID=UPI0022876464|nr:alkaline phosphatase [Corynebacterium yudongzhengii]